MCQKSQYVTKDEKIISIILRRGINIERATTSRVESSGKVQRARLLLDYSSGETIAAIARKYRSCLKSVGIVIFAFLKFTVNHATSSRNSMSACSGSDLQKNGHSENGTQRWRCNHCGKSFQLTYRYHARKPGVKEQIIPLTLNRSGVRDTGRILGINKNTVVSELKKTQRKPFCA